MRRAAWWIISLLVAASCGQDSVPGSMLDLASTPIPDLSSPEVPDLAGCDSDNRCAAPTPVCDVAHHTCVPCLPDADKCPDGKVCVDDGGAWSCVAGCKSDAECAGDGGGDRACCDHACVDRATNDGNCGA